ncbi:MAG TPA: alginate lyase family protein [Puia sp.]|nr:alginate lyase family protein [Puia sp.]
MRILLTAFLLFAAGVAAPAPAQAAAVTAYEPGLLQMGKAAFPPIGQEIVVTLADGKTALRLPLEKEEQLLDFGLNIQTIYQRGKILQLHVDHYGGKDTSTVGFRKEITAVLRKQVLEEAAWAMQQSPVTVTASSSPRSAGGPHDFFSQADYFWPDPKSADSPYVNRDGMTNPDNFTAHRKAMIRLSRVVGALASAYKITGDEKYVRQALDHCRAWFVDTTTRMNPSLNFSQAIMNRVTGRGIGIIDTIHFMEVVQGLLAMEGARTMDKSLLDAIRQWFGEYLTWLTTSAFGKAEMNATNNHGTCWAMQVASFAKFTGNEELMNFCRDRYKKVFLPAQMAADGSFPQELKRTKPYGYSLFNLDAMAMLCQILSTKEDDLWNYETTDGRSVKKGIEFLYPFVEDKNKWTYPPDVMYWKEWPVAQPFLVFGAYAFGRKDWLDTWKRLDHAPANEEVIRNLPVRHPLIWID